MTVKNKYVQVCEWLTKRKHVLQIYLHEVQHSFVEYIFSKVVPHFVCRIEVKMLLSQFLVDMNGRVVLVEVVGFH